MNTYPTSIQDFQDIVADFQASDRYRAPLVYAVGRRVATRNGTVASVRFPFVNGNSQNTGTAAILMKVLGVKPEGVQSVVLQSGMIHDILDHFEPFKNDGKRHDNLELLKWAQHATASVRGSTVATFIFDNVAPQGVDDATLRLYALSNRLYKPRELNLDGIFKVLPKVTWVGDTPMDEGEVDNALLAAAFDGPKYVPSAVDKFPLYIHRINAAKMGVRICDQYAVRLGAYLSEGTVVMYGGYINLNAGTLGASMVEGLIASSAVVGAGSDIGNGAKTIGVLSGGNDVPISIGRNCLLELNSTLGIPIGDATIIAAGVAVLAGSLVRVGVEGHPKNGETVKAAELSGISAATFRRNDKDGVLEVVRMERNEKFARKLADGEDILNADLHQKV